jgi:hypothetical protein
VKPVNSWRVKPKENQHDYSEYALHVTACFYLIDCAEHDGDDGSGQHRCTETSTAPTSSTLPLSGHAL